MTAYRVCFLSFTHPSYDTRILHKEARSLAEAGFDVVHLAPAQGGETDQVVAGVHVQVYAQARGRLARFRQLYALARSVDADAYHCNEVESWLVGMALKAVTRQRKVVFDVHEHYPSRFYESHFPRWIGPIGEPLIRMLFRWVAPLTDHLVFAKRSVAPDFRDRDGHHSFVFNYAPLRFQEHSGGIPEEIRAAFRAGPTAIHIGDLSRARGWPQLLEALAIMRDRRMRVVCLGGVAEGVDVLMAEARRLGVADRVDLRARVPYDQVFDYLRSAQVGLMLYQPGILNHVYAFPMKMYDYMLAGLPVVGPEFALEVEPVIREERCGWGIDTANPQALADVLDEVCRDPEAARAAGQRGTDAVVRRYNWEAEARKLVALYTGFARDALVGDARTATP